MTLAFALLGLLVGAAAHSGAAGWRQHGRSPARIPFCPYCGRPRPAWAWVAAVAYLRLKPACGRCGAPIPWHHLLLEIGTAGLFAALWARLGPGVPLALAVVQASILILLAALDLETRRLPRSILYPACGLVLLGSLLHPEPGFWQLALLGGAVGLAVLLVAHLLGRAFVAAVRRAPGQPSGLVALGWGDVGLGGLIGLMLGFPQVVTALLLGILLAGLAALVIVLAGLARGQVRPFRSLAYGPWLAAGALATMLFQAA